MKVWAQTNNYGWIVTYADNNQFDNFFRKQGFGDSKDHPKFLHSSRVSENVEPYLRATLCACRIDQNVDYINIKSILQQQMD